MTDDQSIELTLFLSDPHPCSYLPQKTAHSQVLMPATSINADIYASLIEQGFRRSGIISYRPRCHQCQACISVRLLVNEFMPNKTQKRIFKKYLETLTISLVSTPQFEEEHYDLFVRYQQKRHLANEQEITKEHYQEFILQSYGATQLLLFHDELKILRMVCVIDQVHQGLSAVYTFYDPDYKGSLGTFAILYLSQLCQQWHLPYLYLGYWVNESEKMHYKIRYQPLEYYQQQTWTRFLTKDI